MSLLDRVAALHVELSEAQAPLYSYSVERAVSWHFLASGSLNVNVDGGLMHINKWTGIGVVIWNNDGLFMAAMAQLFLTWHDPLTMKLSSFVAKLVFIVEIGY